MESVTEGQKTAPVDLSALLDAGDGIMVTLVSGDTQLAVHRSVLSARSPVFAAMFRHDTVESSSSVVDIPDVEGPVLRQMLKYMYTLKAPQQPDMATKLLAAADKYGLSELKSECEQQVVAQLSVETAASSAVLAVRHSCDSLKWAAITFIKSHTHQVMATKGWADAMRSQPEDLIEVSRLLADPPPEPSAAATEASRRGESASPPPSTAADHTPPHENPVAARYRELSDEEKGERLRQAAKTGAAWEVQALLAAGADVEARGSNGWTALHWAAARGHAEVVRTLAAASANVNARSVEDWTPLHLTALNGHAEAATALLEAGAYRRAVTLPEPTTTKRYTPMQIAKMFNKLDVIERLT